jgi:putative transposase
MRSYQKGSHTVHDLKVHPVWITKYRYNVLTNEVGTRIRDLIRQVCDADGIQIIRGRISRDHVRLYVTYPPHLSVSGMMRLIKGRPSRRIREEFPQSGKRYRDRHFRGIGYAAFGSGHVTDEMIREYLKQHENHPDRQDGNFKAE